MKLEEIIIYYQILSNKEKQYSSHHGVVFRHVPSPTVNGDQLSINTFVMGSFNLLTFELMVDSLELFREICNLQWFVTTPTIRAFT